MGEWETMGHEDKERTKDMEFIKSLLRPARILKPTDVQAKMNKAEPPLVLDLRQPAEYQAGHIPGATLLPISELSRSLSELPRDREIVCICNFGANSDSVAQLLSGAGFKSVNMSEGMVGWQHAGLPIKKGESQ
jgi:rhodanese-related sulfurtransferase